MRKGSVTTALATLALAIGCADAERSPPPRLGEADTLVEAAVPTDTTRRADSVEVRVYFTLGEEPRAVERRVPHTDSVLGAALEALLRGPRPAEEAAGYRSFFGPATSGMLREARVDESGRAVVDFADFSRVIPNASTSAGSAMLLAELNTTVFELPAVREVEYRFEGSCDAFWNWLQRGCEVVRRP